MYLSRLLGTSVSAFILFCTSQSWAIDDSDLSGSKNQGFTTGQVPIDLTPDSIEPAPELGTSTFEVVREDHGKLTPVSGLNFIIGSGGQKATTNQEGIGFLPICEKPGQEIKIAASLQDSHFSVTNGSKTYRVAAMISCSGQTRLRFKEDSNGGQALGIWQVAHRAEKKLEESVGLDFWKDEIAFIWPSDADYYFFGSVNVTRGDHWDVVGHEMGHAIYDLGNIGEFGGGQHFIDQCYSENLALSEGWASYFSAWISVGLGDHDAKFEYMVPRRAPIRFENIPEDVCKGEANEWRVTGFFWDLIDLHDDREASQDTFGRIWNAMAGKRPGSASETIPYLKAAGLDPQIMQIVWNLNFGK